MPWERAEYTREELYRMVWAMPVSRAAHSLRLTDVALAKACRRMGVPLPGRGYWARRAAGKPVEPPRLPAADRHQPTTYLAFRWTGAPGEEPPSVPRPRVRPRVAAIVVPEHLEAPHELIAASAPLRAADTNRDATRSAPCVDVVVQTAGLVDRALRIMDALLKTLEANGFTVAATAPARQGRRSAGGEHGSSHTVARKDGAVIRFGIGEEHERVPIKPKRDRVFGYWPPTQRYERRPNGRLCLEIRSQQRAAVQTVWRDGEQQPLETRLGRFVATLLFIAESERQELPARTASAREQE